ncbi:hypothetical protein E3N88_20256 [Mikania micrantha]|uniref:Uncharacterized protein n=1 Tax=Mikania micrantha TaxID=192012 RepID=A0A5N6NIB8_9ASTR|nr:hypothetical protein E3N88_20256 [Mikania micrantha]
MWDLNGSPDLINQQEQSDGCYSPAEENNSRGKGVGSASNSSSSVVVMDGDDGYMDGDGDPLVTHQFFPVDDTEVGPTTSLAVGTMSPVTNFPAAAHWVGVQFRHQSPGFVSGGFVGKAVPPEVGSILHMQLHESSNNNNNSNNNASLDHNLDLSLGQNPAPNRQYDRAIGLKSGAFGSAQGERYHQTVGSLEGNYESCGYGRPRTFDPPMFHMLLSPHHGSMNQQTEPSSSTVIVGGNESNKNNVHMYANSAAASSGFPQQRFGLRQPAAPPPYIYSNMAAQQWL